MISLTTLWLRLAVHAARAKIASVIGVPSANKRGAEQTRVARKLIAGAKWIAGLTHCSGSFPQLSGRVKIRLRPARNELNLLRPACGIDRLLQVLESLDPVWLSTAITTSPGNKPARRHLAPRIDFVDQALVEIVVTLAPRKPPCLKIDSQTPARFFVTLDASAGRRSREASGNADRQRCRVGQPRIARSRVTDRSSSGGVRGPRRGSAVASAFEFRLATQRECR